LEDFEFDFEVPPQLEGFVDAGLDVREGVGVGLVRLVGLDRWAVEHVALGECFVGAVEADLSCGAVGGDILGVDIEREHPEAVVVLQGVVGGAGDRLGAVVGVWMDDRLEPLDDVAAGVVASGRAEELGKVVPVGPAAGLCEWLDDDGAETDTEDDTQGEDEDRG
jgi:hypothetical protein